MKLNLTHPIVFFDLETTGLDQAKDRIVQISVLKITVDGKEEQKTWLVNPEMPIPAESTKVHHITDADVANAPTLRQLAPEIIQFFGAADIAGYNIIKFDVPVLVEELLRVGQNFDLSSRHIIDVMNIYMKMEPRTLSAAYKHFYHKEIENPHSADADTKATYDVLKAMLDAYKDEEYTDHDGNVSKPVVNDMQALSQFSYQHKNADIAGHLIYNEKNEIVFNFGKHKNEKVVDVFHYEPQYYSWIMDRDFPEYTKRIITQIKLDMGGKTAKL